MGSDDRLVGGDDVDPGAQGVAQRVGIFMRAAHRLDDDVDIAGERLGEAVGVEHGLVAAVGRADQHLVEDEQVGAVEEIVHHACADGAAAEQRDFQFRALEGQGFDQGKFRDGGFLGRADRRDFDHHVILGGDADRFFLDQPGTDADGVVIIELGEAFGEWVLGWVLIIDAVDVLDQADAVGVEPGGEEDCGEVGPATAQRDNAVGRMARGEAGDDEHVMAVELIENGVGVEPGEGRIERFAGRDEAHLVRVHGRRADPDLAERAGKQRGRVKFPSAGDAGQQQGLLTADAHALVEQGVGFPGQRRDDRNDLFAVANVAIAFVGDRGVVALGLEHARPEFEDTKSLGRGALVHCRQPSSFSARGAIKKPARLVGERVGNVSLSDDDQPIPPRGRVIMVVVIVMVALVMSGVVCGGNTRRVKPKARFGIPFDDFRSDAMCRGHSLWPKFRDESGPRREQHI